MHTQSRIVLFLFGLILGVLGAIYLPKYASPYLPESIVGKQTVVRGTVLAKEKKGNALLVTVNTAQGALLATFTKKADEVNLLVNVNDALEFTLDKYTPFIDDPRITRVLKGREGLPAEPEKAPAAPSTPAEKSTKEVKPQRRGKPAPAAPAAKGATEPKPQSRENVTPARGEKGIEQ